MVNVNGHLDFFITIIIIIKKCWKCMAGRERLTPYQSEDPSSTMPTHRMKEEKKKSEGNKKWRAARQIKGIDPALEIRMFNTIENGVTKIVPQRYWHRKKSCDTERFCSEEAHNCADVRPKHRM